MTRTALETTANYYQASPSARFLRLVLAVVQAMGTSPAAQVANRVFCTPLPPKWLNRRTPWDDSWRIERWPFENASLTVYQSSRNEDGPLALLTHGWGGHAGQMLPLAEMLAERGLRPVILELPAHGRNKGSTSNLVQFSRAIEYTARRLLLAAKPGQGEQLRLIAAHSLGANGASFAASRGLPVERLVLLAPPASPLQYTRLFAHVFGLKEATRQAMQRLIESREAIVMPQFEPQAVGPRIHAQTLVIHDHEDRINPFADGLAFARAIPGAKLIDTLGLGHRKILKDPAILEQIGDFAVR